MEKQLASVSCRHKDDKMLDVLSLQLNIFISNILTAPYDVLDIFIAPDIIAVTTTHILPC